MQSRPSLQLSQIVPGRVFINFKDKDAADKATTALLEKGIMTNVDAGQRCQRTVVVYILMVRI